MVAKIERKYSPERMCECIEVSVGRDKKNLVVSNRYPVKKDGRGNESVDNAIVSQLRTFSELKYETIFKGV